MRRRPIGDEELAAVGVLATVGTRQHSFVGVGQPDALVVELVTVDGLATGAVALSSVATLHHEALDNPVELVALV